MDSKNNLDISENNLDISENNLDISENHLDISENNLDISKNNLDISENHLDISENNLDISKNHLDISENHLDISKNHLDISENYLDISENHLDISENNLDISENHLDISENHLDIFKNHLDISENNLDISENHVDISENHLDISENHLDISENEITCLCFSGGGIQGFSFIGVLKKLIECDKLNLDKINMYVGTSVGSMLCFLFILGFSIKESEDFIINFNFSKLNSEIDCIHFLEKFGINDGEKIKLLFIKCLELKLNVKDITFIELFNKTEKKLLIVGTNLSKGQEELFSIDTTPNMSVITAIRISSSVPIIFTPITYNNSLYVDGALVNNFPINYCPKDKTLGIYIKNCNENFDIDSIQSLIIKCLSITSDTISEKNLNLEYKNIIKIINPNSEFTKFDLTYEYKKNLIELGYKTTEDYLNRII